MHPRPAMACLLALALLLLAPACAHRNDPVTGKDIPLRVTLARSWLATRAAIDATQIDLPFTCNLEDADSFEELFALPFAYILHLGVEGTINLAAYALCVIPKTKVVVYPALRPTYRQRLYWGENVVHFPATDSPEQARMLVQVSGDRTASFTLTVDLTHECLRLE
ncbi:MAG: hypothetical protein ACOCYP_10570 [Planctomycetota bacterium]